MEQRKQALEAITQVIMKGCLQLDGTIRMWYNIDDVMAGNPALQEQKKKVGVKTNKALWVLLQLHSNNTLQFMPTVIKKKRNKVQVQLCAQRIVGEKPMDFSRWQHQYQYPGAISLSDKRKRVGLRCTEHENLKFMDSDDYEYFFQGEAVLRWQVFVDAGTIEPQRVAMRRKGLWKWGLGHARPIEESSLAGKTVRALLPDVFGKKKINSPPPPPPPVRLQRESVLA